MKVTAERMRERLAWMEQELDRLEELERPRIKKGWFSLFNTRKGVTA
jgi:hypothetical protein